MEQDHPNDNADIEQPKAKKAMRECHSTRIGPRNSLALLEENKVCLAIS